jgi:UDP-N-acetylglucosamine 1-carboxyvinyltransferase
LDYIEIFQSKNLKGSIKISGAKNSALPALASTILAKNDVCIKNLPNVKDINTFLKLLSLLGGRYYKDETSGCFIVNTKEINSTTANYDIVKTMRASILVLGPLLARFGKCEVSLPGGCAIGQRPVDLHLKALEGMGAKIEIKNGYIIAKAPNGLKGSVIVFDKITVTGSENIIMAAALAKGKTKIINVAKEPEVVQLCEILQNAGVKITNIGSDEIEIEGTNKELLDFKQIDIIPDRIEAGTYLCAGAITNSALTLKEVEPEHLKAIIQKLELMNFTFDIKKDEITIFPAKKIAPIQIVTSEYPGFPTDMQAQFMALATQADGTSTIEERLFENRLMHVNELKRLGANITVNGNTTTIYGKTELFGADVMATDLRASSALVLAGLIAKGKTKVHRIYHLDRGYDNLDNKLQSIGVKLLRGKEAP